MKHIKKLASLLLAVVMILALATTAFATGASTPTTYAITVDTTNDAASHTYKVYQIFTGTPSDGTQLTDLRYGTSYKDHTGAVPETELTAIGTSDAAARAFAKKLVADRLLGPEVATLNGTTTSYNAVPGYYLVLDTNYTASDTTKDAYSAFMLQVVNEDTTFTPKKRVPTVEKLVKDEVADKDTNADSEGWGKTADHAIGETFQFKLTATIPQDTNLAAYNTYKVVFNDTMSSGVTFEQINSVKVNGTNVTYYTTTATTGQAGGSWTLTIADVKAIAGTDWGTKPITVVVEYDAHLNTDATVNKASGTTDNKNDVSLTYSNNPDATGSGETDTTPKDSVWVFTYEVDNTKVDAGSSPVSGAKFQLYSGNAEGTTKPSGTPISLYKVGTTYYVYDSAKSDYTGGTVVTEMETTANGKFDIKGLDAGTYTLYESGVPTGYVQATNTIVKIAATHVVETGTPKVTLTADSNTTNSIVNYTGAALPSTGGIGTTIFYVTGAVLALGAGILLITKRRMNR